MSVNHYSTDHHHHHHHTLLWQHHHNTTATWQNDDQRESLFEKTLTPSDVGKLNRLVIPKQHAEKHFPLNNNNNTISNTDTSSSEKGMLLSFEDETGKCWRFRYSYWNSSQSYVLTKGWSRFVKDKQLDPGDVVFFQRHRSGSPRFFIGWRRRGGQNSNSSVVVNNTTTSYSNSMAPPYNIQQLQANSNYNSNHLSHSEYSQYGSAVATSTDTHFTPSASTVAGSSRTVRLFGVNLECQMDEDDGEDSSAAATVAVDCPDGYYGTNVYYS